MHHIKFTSANGGKHHYIYPSHDITWVFTIIKNLRTRNVQFTHYFEE